MQRHLRRVTGSTSRRQIPRDRVAPRSTPAVYQADPTDNTNAGPMSNKADATSSNTPTQLQARSAKENHFLSLPSSPFAASASQYLLKPLVLPSPVLLLYRPWDFSLLSSESSLSFSCHQKKEGKKNPREKEEISSRKEREGEIKEQKGRKKLRFVLFYLSPFSPVWLAFVSAFSLNPSSREIMEWWERPPSRRGRNKPSFSSSLLDSIYRSIDESDGGGGGPAPDHRRGGAPDPSFTYSSTATAAAAARKKQSADELEWNAAAVSHRAVIRRGSRDCSRCIVTPASSSSDSSSYGGFSSSSEAESAAAYYSAGVKPVLSDRIRSGGPEVPPEKKKGSSIRSRLRDLRKGRAPTSPGARLASFLNGLFTAVGNPKKPKIAAPPSLESACSRSCLSKTPSSRGRRKPSAAGDGGKRSVRFCPVSVIVGEDCRPCGHKCLYDADLTAAAGPGPRPPAVVRRVEELLRGLEGEEEEDAISDSSSDLFELENLTGIGRYRDELPVYETTDVGTNHAIAQGLVV
uniref:Protein BIG GRAIN 1-like n=1 Tax=Elaeis guineensis var. tenera TaxID=51953 RepID=A0A6I9RUG2_ELAGV|nr:protein BIG GRAIN 1-like [Elaeis guineensis]